MIFLIKYFILFFLSLEFFFNTLNYYSINISFLFLFIFILCYFLNFFFLKTNVLKLDIDLIFKYILIFLKTPNFFLNYFVNIIKKIYIFLIFFKYKFFFNTLKILSKNFSSNIFIFWRPLFKKTSYFGYFRSNRSKWIK